jgi:hypothetical protein
MLGGSGHGGGDLTARLDKEFLQFRIRPLIHGGPGDEQVIAAGGQKRLMPAEKFAEAAFGAVAQDGVADGGGRSDEARAREVNRNGSGGGDGPGKPPDGESAGVVAAAFGTDGANVALAAEMLLRAETHGTAAVNGRGRISADSDDGQTLAAFETAGADDFAAAFGGHAGAVADLAGAFLAMRAEGGLHDA